MHFILTIYVFFIVVIACSPYPLTITDTDNDDYNVLDSLENFEDDSASMTSTDSNCFYILEYVANQFKCFLQVFCNRSTSPLFESGSTKFGF